MITFGPVLRAEMRGPFTRVPDIDRGGHHVRTDATSSAYHAPSGGEVAHVVDTYRDPNLADAVDLAGLEGDVVAWLIAPDCGYAHRASGSPTGKVAILVNDFFATYVNWCLQDIYAARPGGVAIFCVLDACSLHRLDNPHDFPHLMGRRVVR